MENNKKEWKKPELTKIDVNFNTENGVQMTYNDASLKS